MFPKFRFVRTGDFVRNGAALENFECLASACGGIGLGRFEMIGRYAEQYARDNGFKCILLDTGEVIEKGEPTAFVLIAAFCMAFPAFAEIISDETTGASCGSGLKWSYDTDTKTLTVSGTGKISDFDETSTGMLAPWRKVTKITGNLETVNILDSVSSIGDQAFAGTALYNECYDNSELYSVLYIGNHLIK